VPASRRQCPPLRDRSYSFIAALSARSAEQWQRSLIYARPVSPPTRHTEYLLYSFGAPFLLASLLATGNASGRSHIVDERASSNRERRGRVGLAPFSAVKTGVSRSAHAHTPRAHYTAHRPMLSVPTTQGAASARPCHPHPLGRRPCCAHTIGQTLCGADTFRDFRVVTDTPLEGLPVVMLSSPAYGMTAASCSTFTSFSRPPFRARVRTVSTV
jgi:hypothetical protein